MFSRSTDETNQIDDITAIYLSNALENNTVI